MNVTTPPNQKPTNFTALTAQFELKIDDSAFEFYKHARDYKNDEIAMFGVTKKDNPLHVTEFVITKQKVNPVAADMDEDYMSWYEGQQVMKGILPINCSRVWAHTHPMTGQGSANPSGKDMGTWEHENNKHKNLFVMLILSRSGEISCRLRVRGNISSIVVGLENEITIEREIPVRIIPTEEHEAAIVKALTEKFGEKAVTTLGADKNILYKYIKYEDVYPEKVEAFKKSYAELVSPTDTYSNFGKKRNDDFGGYSHEDGYYVVQNGHSHHRKIGIQQQKVTVKKRAQAEIVPEVLYALSKDAITFKGMDPKEIELLQSEFTDITGQEDLDIIEHTFFSERTPAGCINALLGAITGKLLTFETQSSNPYITFSHADANKRIASINAAQMTYPEFCSASVSFNQVSPTAV